MPESGQKVELGSKERTMHMLMPFKADNAMRTGVYVRNFSLHTGVQCGVHSRPILLFCMSCVLSEACPVLLGSVPNNHAADQKFTCHPISTAV